MGSHPIGAVIHLKHWEGLRVAAPHPDAGGLRRGGQPHTAPVRRGLKRYMSTRAVDVEDWSVAVLTFEDGTMATIHSNDITLGGVATW
jgi:hypothetical protein